MLVVVVVLLGHLDFGTAFRRAVATPSERAAASLGACRKNPRAWRDRVPSLKGASKKEILLALNKGNRLWWHIIDGKDASLGKWAYEGELSHPVKPVDEDSTKFSKKHYIQGDWVGAVEHAYERMADMLDNPLAPDNLLELNLISRGVKVPSKIELLDYMAPYGGGTPTETLKNYNGLIRSLNAASVNGLPSEVLSLCAKSAFEFAYMHPFPDGNGRTRTMLLNLCLTSHGGHPVIMYDNNHGMFQLNMSVSTYSETVLEGYCFWEAAVPAKWNPWDVEANVEAHNERFGKNYCDHEWQHNKGHAAEGASRSSKDCLINGLDGPTR